ncbi:MAG: hypothetical protein AAFV07_13330 [Bacteroidota bacterium]
MHKVFLLSLLMSTGLIAWSQVAHVGPLTIRDVNRYHWIGLTRVLQDSSSGRLILEITEELKNASAGQHLQVQGRSGQGKRLNQYEAWLIFAEEVAQGEFEVDWWQSVRLCEDSYYHQVWLEDDLDFLRSVRGISEEINSVFQPSSFGCVPDENWREAHGKLVNGHPHGRWVYRFQDGRKDEVGFYWHGKKIGWWLSYHQNGVMDAQAFYYLDELWHYRRCDSSGRLFDVYTKGGPD